MKKIILFVCLMASVIALHAQERASITLLRSHAPTDYVWVASHRGDWIYAPENSLLSLEHAIFFGSDMMETDVRMTKDGKFIMMHDHTVDRTTNGHGKISDLTLAEIEKLRLKNNFGIMTDLKVPTLEQFLELGHNKIIIYLDKAGQEDLPGTPQGYKVQALLKVLKAHNALNQCLFVLDWPYDVAKKIFGDDLEKTFYVPVIEDKIPNLDKYVDDYITKLNPVAFQFRMSSVDTPTYKQLAKVLKSSSKPFIAATWDEHTANHSDRVSIFEHASDGWGWLLRHGFSILETNYPHDLIPYLQRENRRTPVAK